MAGFFRAWRVMLFRCCGWLARDLWPSVGAAPVVSGACVKKKKIFRGLRGMLLFRRLHGRVAFVIYDQ
jgi:hypothetical protein